MRFQRGKNMQVNTIENREDYVSIKELIDAINQKYMLYSYNSKNSVVRSTKQLLEKKIVSTIKKENSIDYFQEDRGRKFYLINRESVNTLMDLLEKYIFSRSQLDKRDIVIYNQQLSEIGDGSRKDKTLKELQLKKSPDYLEDRELQSAEKCIIRIVKNNVYNTSYDPVHKVVNKIVEFTINSYEDFAEAFKAHFNRQFEEKLNHDLNMIKSEITFQNSMMQQYTSFNQVEYITDYCLRELHTIKYNDTFIITKGYSKYDIKLQNPLVWYCRK